jgi:AraC-like DNA-binding protein
VAHGRDEIGHALELNLRPCEITHRVEFGPQGALILAVDVADSVTHGMATGWIRRKLSRAQRTLLGCVLAEKDLRDTVASECIQDLVAGIQRESFEGSPPRWLMLAREHLIEAPANVRIDALARAAGVHRSHFARAFQHWFNTPPSLFRRRAMLSRAIAAMASGQSLARAAHTAGFADQSHLCRSMRELMGITPHRLLPGT